MKLMSLLSIPLIGILSAMPLGNLLSMKVPRFAAAGAAVSAILARACC